MFFRIIRFLSKYLHNYFISMKNIMFHNDEKFSKNYKPTRLVLLHKLINSLYY